MQKKKIYKKLVVYHRLRTLRTYKYSSFYFIADMVETSRWTEEEMEVAKQGTKYSLNVQLLKGWLIGFRNCCDSQLGD